MSSIRTLSQVICRLRTLETTYSSIGITGNIIKRKEKKRKKLILLLVLRNDIVAPLGKEKRFVVLSETTNSFDKRNMALDKKQ